MMMTMLSKRSSLRLPVMCFAKAPPRLPPRRTGGGGNGDNKNNNKSSNSNDDDYKPRDRLKMLNRSYSPSTSVPVELFMDAMKHRWGRVYTCELGSDGCSMIITCKEVMNGSDLAGLTAIVAVLNKWGLAAQFAAYLKHDPAVSSPASMPGGILVINLNVPSSGDSSQLDSQPRACEFRLSSPPPPHPPTAEGDGKK